MRADPLLGSRDQIAIGHSWGLANITSFEVAHTHYDKVVSLSGAGMLPDGKPDPDTQHADFSYQDSSSPFSPSTPSGTPPSAFEHGEYYRGPHDDILESESVTVNVNGVPQQSVDLRAFGVPRTISSCSTTSEKW